MKKFIFKLSYKLGELSNKTPSLSLNPLKELYKSFKQGREDSKPKDYTVL